MGGERCWMKKILLNNNCLGKNGYLCAAFYVPCDGK
jgi:hypothetical protein